MPIRPFKFPDDISTVLDITVDAFQYNDPSKQAWSVPFNLEEALHVQLQAVRRLYPLLWIANLFTRDVRSILRGFIDEENHKAVGAAMTARLFKAPYFEIGNVGVKPKFRRRGIAKQLVEACMADVQNWGAKFVHLSVIEGNDPAIRLYEDLGFSHYSGTSELALYPANTENSQSIAGLAKGYRLTTIGFAEWQPRYNLAERITPQSIQEFCPVCPEQFQWMTALRWLGPLFFRWSKSRLMGIGVETDDGVVVGTAELTVQYGNNAANTLKLSVDPAHADITPAFLKLCVDIFQANSAEHTILMSVESWQEWVVDAAVEFGFRIDYHQSRMGMRFTSPY